jgi:hypothetical protein
MHRYIQLTQAQLLHTKHEIIGFQTQVSLPNFIGSSK